MITFLSEPIVLHIALAAIELPIALWAIRRAARNYDEHKDIVVDGWITRWSDGPEAYKQEHRQNMRRHRDAIEVIILMVAPQIFLWKFL